MKKGSLGYCPTRPAYNPSGYTQHGPAHNISLPVRLINWHFKGRRMRKDSVWLRHTGHLNCIVFANRHPRHSQSVSTKRPPFTLHSRCQPNVPNQTTTTLNAILPAVRNVLYGRVGKLIAIV